MWCSEGTSDVNRLQGKVAIVTGGSQGQGAAEAALFVAEGARVVIADISDEDGCKLADTLGDAAVYAHLDVTEEQVWAEVVADTVARWGRIDVLVNNAGRYKSRSIEHETVNNLMTSINLNQIAPFLGIKAVLGPMRAGGGGSIINISSTAGLLGAPNSLAYNSTKFAVRGLTRSAALELAPDKIRVNAVLPGIVDTPSSLRIRPEMREQMAAATPLGRWGRSDEAANLVLFLASDESSFCTGGDYVVDGGSTA
jgi:3alpha(or 20beta)-hydroxysteroid dehydrogenase